MKRSLLAAAAATFFLSPLAASAARVRVTAIAPQDTFSVGGSIVSLQAHTQSIDCGGQGSHMRIVDVLTASNTTTTPDSFNEPFTVEVILMDEQTDEVQTFMLEGTIAGTLSQNQSNLQVSLSSPKMVTAVLGGQVYTVTIGPIAPPPPPISPDWTTRGSSPVMAHVTCGAPRATAVEDVAYSAPVV